MIGPFGLQPKGTMRARALPMAKALAERGVKVSLLMPPWQTPAEAGKTWEEDGVRLEYVPVHGVPGAIHAQIVARLASKCIAEAPDVVHAFKPKAYAGGAATCLWLLRALRLASGFRLIVDTDDWEGPGGWNEIGGYGALHKVVFAWQERWGLRHADAVTVASRALQTLAWSLGVPPQRVFYVPNAKWSGGHEAAPLDRPARAAARRSWGLPAGPLILLYTRFFEFRPDEVTDILQRVVRQLPAAHLLLAGKGLAGEEQHFAALAAQVGLGDKITYAGWISTHEASMLGAADLAIYPASDSLINRARSPVKLLDLMSAGLPVVAHAVGHARDVIVHGDSGWLVQPGDGQAFADAVVHLLRQPALRRGIGRRARERIAQHFDWRRLVDVVLQAYGVQ
jgi:glycosyltransferase involved in cell wall biosynthesis